ncbi:hypothetical protein B0A50_01945 [Salinomyces thailandicus]|uniref:Steroid 5-alpha reductase C-terminal domain-containing protein n=1 Tax=Salinomyces thailandicus TaxID=706561 RepID=A0A4U0U7H6_9PEZI|nr:hypothetical protein B0A50_01945 [Salinomyces thailandica]
MHLPTPPDLALPAVSTLPDCADYHLTLAPYLPDLNSLSTTLLSHLTSLDLPGLRNLYATTNPALSALGFSLALMPVFFVVSEANKNYSQVDRVWSILPTVYHAHYAVWAHLNHLPTQRMNTLLAFSFLWSARLTFNYWRKGGYEVGSEDYRWNIIKDKIGTVGLVVLNILFISSVQSILLWAITTPAYLLLLTARHDPTTENLSDILAPFVLLTLLALETLADNQMSSYQAAKRNYQRTAKPTASPYTRAQLDRGFCTTGLWRYSRHPNFACEQAIWLTIYAWGCLATGTWWNWTGVGALGYLGVFAGSTPLTEWVSGGKYPEYRVYQRRVGRFVPKLFGKGWDEAEMEKMGKKK